jgi:hypothetical protein
MAKGNVADSVGERENVRLKRLLAEAIMLEAASPNN